MGDKHRCQWTWNPGEWPYTKRCKNEATKLFDDNGEYFWLCPDHADQYETNLKDNS